MDLLIDTNVLLDVILQREPFEIFSGMIFKMCVTRECRGIVAAHSFTDMFYLLRKHFSQKDLRKLLLNLLDYFEVSSLDKQKLLGALHRPEFSDFEDCLQDECAAELNADYIITRNTRDYRSSRVQALTPEEFLRLKAGDRKYS